jgi:hypothetical protein
MIVCVRHVCLRLVGKRSLRKATCPKDTAPEPRGQTPPALSAFYPYAVPNVRLSLGAGGPKLRNAQ